MATLYTFGPSHFCEKARWALDLCGVAYREVRWVPGPHLLAARRIAAGTTVPILAGEGGIVQGSCPIMDSLERGGRVPWHHGTSAGQREEITQITARADQIGVAIRRLIYTTALESAPEPVARLLFDGASTGQRTIGRLMWPVTRQSMMSSLRARADDLPEAHTDAMRKLDELDHLIGERSFLVGDRLTRADIALASLIAPIAHPAEHPVYRDGEPWPAYQAIIDACSERPSMRWSRRIYRDFRPPQSRPRS